jgi:1,4-alpha-glucan branching enzyme
LAPLRARFALTALLVLPLGGCRARLAPTRDADGAIHLRHRAPPGAEVSVVGDFNHWEPGVHPLAPTGEDLYEGTLHLPPGTYTYAFAQRWPDGGVEVVAPERAPGYVTDDFGGQSGVLVIPAER